MKKKTQDLFFDYFKQDYAFGTIFYLYSPLFPRVICYIKTLLYKKLYKIFNLLF